MSCSPEQLYRQNTVLEPAGAADSLTRSRPQAGSPNLGEGDQSCINSIFIFKFKSDDILVIVIMPHFMYDQKDGACKI